MAFSVQLRVDGRLNMRFAEPGEWTDPIRNAAERFLESLLDLGAFEFPGETEGGREFREDL